LRVFVRRFQLLMLVEKIESWRRQIDRNNQVAQPVVAANRENSSCFISTCAIATISRRAGLA
jgi:hypothetical protein